MNETVTIKFESKQDAAWFLRCCERQLENKSDRVYGSTLGILLDSLRKAKSVESSMTDEEAKKMRTFGGN